MYSRQRWNLYNANISEPSHEAQKSSMLLISSSVHEQNDKLCIEELIEDINDFCA